MSFRRLILARTLILALAHGWNPDCQAMFTLTDCAPGLDPLLKSAHKRSRRALRRYQALIKHAQSAAFNRGDNRQTGGQGAAFISRHAPNLAGKRAEGIAPFTRSIFLLGGKRAFHGLILRRLVDGLLRQSCPRSASEHNPLANGCSRQDRASRPQ